MFFAAEVSGEADMVGVVGDAGPGDPLFSMGELSRGAAFGGEGGDLE